MRAEHFEQLLSAPTLILHFSLPIPPKTLHWGVLDILLDIQHRERNQSFTQAFKSVQVGSFNSFNNQALLWQNSHMLWKSWNTSATQSPGTLHRRPPTIRCTTGDTKWVRKREGGTESFPKAQGQSLFSICRSESHWTGSWNYILLELCE